MAKYKIIRVYHHSEYAYVEANSEEEAKEKAIENDCWEKTLMMYFLVTNTLLLNMINNNIIFK